MLGYLLKGHALRLRTARHGLAIRDFACEVHIGRADAACEIESDREEL
jgi:hypothetical protein